VLNHLIIRLIDIGKKNRGLKSRIKKFDYFFSSKPPFLDKNISRFNEDPETVWTFG